MSLLADVIAPRLRGRYPQHRLRLDAGPPQRIVIPAVHPAVGDIVIYDDEGELTVMYGNFTHSHYGPFQPFPSPDLEQTIEDLCLDLDALFADRMVMWGSHETSGGRFLLEHESHAEECGPQYVWSGPRRGG